MTSAPSLALIFCLAVSTVPLTAQHQIPVRLVIPAIHTQAGASARITPQFARKPGGVLKGAIIGGSIGAVLASTIGQEACLHKPRWHCAVKGAVSFGTIGALIGWLH